MGSLHHLQVGYGDASIIITPSATFVIDCYNIDKYANLLPQDKIIKALFITHQHEDHFLGMNFLKENNYSIEYLIYSPYKRRRNDSSVRFDEWQSFTTLAEYFNNKGSKVYTPFRQDSFDKPWWDVSGLSYWMIGPEKSIAQSDTRELHDASLVIHVNLGGGRRCCFTGDASDASLNWIANHTNNYCNDILHASHHGSLNGADLDFIKKANAQYTVISTQPGVHDKVPHPTALKRYEDNTEKSVYRTDINGSLQWDF